MSITNNNVVQFHYTLTSDGGETIDSSEGREPLAYLHGHDNIVPGLEKEMEGKQVGDKFDVKVAPAEGYGERHLEMIQQVPRTAFQGVDDIQPGMQFEAQTDAGPRPVVVTAVDADTVTVDGNHPLAGENLNFAVEVTEIRDASAEEIEHGHPHGPGGHQH